MIGGEDHLKFMGILREERREKMMRSEEKRKWAF